MYRHSPTYAVLSGRFGADRIWVYTRSNRCVYRQRYSWNPNSNTLEPDRPQPDRPAACVIAQQYSYASLVSLRFHAGKEKFSAFKFFFIFCVLKIPWFLNCIYWNGARQEVPVCRLWNHWLDFREFWWATFWVCVPITFLTKCGEK